MKRQKIYKTFLDKISRELDQTSESHAEAFCYWIRTGNLVHIDASYDSYPNVTLTCIHPNFDSGRNLLSDGTFFLSLKTTIIIICP